MAQSFVVVFLARLNFSSLRNLNKIFFAFESELLIRVIVPCSGLSELDARVVLLVVTRWLPAFDAHLHVDDDSKLRHQRDHVQQRKQHDDDGEDHGRAVLVPIVALVGRERQLNGADRDLEPILVDTLTAWVMAQPRAQACSLDFAS